MVAVTLASSQAPRPATCSDRCGDVEIPYPFGIEPSCYMEVPGQDEQQFKVTCDQATTPPLLKFLSDILNQSITNISIGESEMQVMLPTSRHCYTDGYYNESLYRNSELILPSGYTISDKNKVYIIGCNKIALYQGFVTQVEPERTEIEKLGTTGVSMCQDLLGALSNNCSGVGCTQRTIISGLHSINLDVWTISLTVNLPAAVCCTPAARTAPSGIRPSARTRLVVSESETLSSLRRLTKVKVLYGSN
ncbi:hypothetical protein ACLB2K_023747 [Fragaria x ananassa]